MKSKVGTMRWIKIKKKKNRRKLEEKSFSFCIQKCDYGPMKKKLMKQIIKLIELKMSFWMQKLITKTKVNEARKEDEIKSFKIRLSQKNP